MGLNFNPFSGKFDFVDNEKIRETNVVYVDVLYGNDSTGAVNLSARPFATFNAAWDAVGLSSAKNDITFYLSKGTHTLTAVLNENPWGILVDEHRKISIICEGLPSQTVINSSVVGPMITISSQNADKELYIQGGTWNRTSITGATMFNVATTNRNEFIIKGANVNDVSGTGSVFVQRTTELIKDCRVIGTTNTNIFVGSSTTSSALKVVDSYFSFPTASAVFTSTVIRGNSWINCEVRIPTGRIAITDGNLSFRAKDCYFEGTGVLLDGRAISARFENTKLKTLTNNPVIRFDTATNPGLMTVDGLYLEQPDTTAANCLTRVDRGMCPIYVYGRGLWYSERNPPVAGSDPNTSNSGPNGRVGFRLGSATIGNVITINLPGSSAMLAGNPYNGSPIVYNVVSTVILDELTAMQALVQAQVAIPGTPWNIWCQGDQNLVRINTGGNRLFIIMHPLAPGYTKLSLTTNYSSDTLGDINDDSNEAANGIVDLAGGPQYALKDIPRRNGFTDYPETFLNPTLNIRQF